MWQRFHDKELPDSGSTELTVSTHQDISQGSDSMIDGSPPRRRAGKIALLLPSLEGGGAERSMLNLINAFLDRDREVDLLICRAKGAYLDEVPDAVNMVTLEPTGNLVTRWLAAAANLGDLPALVRPVILASKIAPEIARLRSLRRYIEKHKPDILVSAITYANLVAIWAKNASGGKMPVVVSERIALSTHCGTRQNRRKWRWRYLPSLVRRCYPHADAVVAVSGQVADDLVTAVGLDRKTVTTIYNPVVDRNLLTQAAQALEHEWFGPDAPPVILGVGRLTQQKGFAALIRAFAKVRANRPVRLLILGEGKLRAELQNLATELGISDDVQLPGFVANPFKYMANSAAFVLSSEYEGLPGVLIQALACGCPVISTDCPGGSAEILANGKYGPLVPVGGEDELRRAIEAVLDNPADRNELLQRAELFSVESAANSYLELLDDLVGR